MFPSQPTSTNDSDQGGTFRPLPVDGVKPGPQTENIHPVKTTAKG